MYSFRRSHRVATLLGAALLAASLHGAALAQAEGALPPVQKSGAVDYLSGGIGLDESTAIKNASGQWPLSLVFSVQSAARAQFASDVKLEIRDAKGALALEATAARICWRAWRRAATACAPPWPARLWSARCR